MPTPSTNAREQAIHAALPPAHKKGAPPERDNNPTANLVTLSYDIADLCWSIRVLKDTTENERSIATAARAGITKAANHIIYLCLAELDDIRKGTDQASITITCDCAESSLRGGYPLDQLDLNINTDERIKRLIEALGQAAPYWLHSDNTTQAEIAYREETIAMVAYQAACTIVANSRGLI